ncbi:unnamed protein product, partial [Ectocarpus fasciculatus]
RAPPKRQRKASESGTMGGGTAATSKTQSSRTTVTSRDHGRSWCQEHGCTKQSSY